MKWFLFGAAAILLFSIFFHNIIEFDQDLGRHLLMGKIISETWSVPKTNLLSYSQTDFAYINSHWLSEVIFYAVSKDFGIVSLLYLKVVVMLTAFGLALYTAYKYSKSLMATALAFAIFSPVLLERTEIRPEMFSYLFIAIFMFILLRPERHPELVSGSLNLFENSHSREMLKRVQHDKLIWLLPILQIFWVNLHIYFILGPILVTIFLISKLKDKRYLAVLLTCYLANLLNPNFISGALYPLQVFNNYGYSIVENQNIFFLQGLVFNPNILYFEIAVAAFVLSLVLSFKKITPYPTVLLSSLVVLPFLHIRSFPLLFLIELPIFAFAIANTKYKILNSKYLLIAIILLALFRSYRLVSNEYYSSIGSNKIFGNQVNESYKGAADFVIANLPAGRRVFNNFDIGSYLDYRFLYSSNLTPDHWNLTTPRVFVDGRPEAYPATFFQNLYIPMQVTPDNFRQVNDVYHFNLIVFSITDATPWGRTFLQDILKNDRFEMVYLDSNAVVLVKKDVFPNVVKNITLPQAQAQKLVREKSGLILF